MPEEINRILTDRMLICCSAPPPLQFTICSARESSRGVPDRRCDDGCRAPFFGRWRRANDPFADLGIDRKGYCLLTCHRPQNTDDPQVLGELVDAFLQAEKTLVFPVHPRTRKMLSQFDFWQLLQKAPHIRLIEPVGYLEMIQLEKQAEMIITDSGGVQKESYFFGVPCITLRSETEWVETVQDGWNLLVGHQRERILDALNHFQPAGEQTRHYGDGHASKKIVDLILNDGHRSP
jgi:UDP-N-acetylglucosamine 2-epimerase (non-hydrolysing)